MQFLLNKFSLCLVLLIAGLTGCSEQTPKDEEAMIELPNDFRAFYDKFIGDSTYQMAHIAFPLQGLPGPDKIDSTGAYIPWKKETWKIHKPIANIADYIHTFDILSDDLIVETIQERSAPIAMQRRFARMAEGWNLIYYVDMQPLSKKESQ